jgi:DNA-directed RNA polymerase subunit K/omega
MADLEDDDYGEPDNLEPDEDEDEDEDEDDETTVPEDPPPQDTFDNITVVVQKPENRMTSDLMSLTEYCAVLGVRAQQIENGDDFYIDIQFENNSIDIAKKELLAGKSPCIIERILDTKHNITIVEHWKISELKLPTTTES